MTEYRLIKKNDAIIIILQMIWFGVLCIGFVAGLIAENPWTPPLNIAIMGINLYILLDRLKLINTKESDIVIK